MARSQNINNLEKDKFRDAPNDSSKVAVVIEGDSGLLEGVSYDEIVAAYPTPTTETYTYKALTITVATILVTYQDSSKEVLSSVRRL